MICEAPVYPVIYWGSGTHTLLTQDWDTNRHPPAGWPYYHPTTARWGQHESWPTTQPHGVPRGLVLSRGVGAGLLVQGSRGHEIGDVLAKGEGTRLSVKGRVGG